MAGDEAAELRALARRRSTLVCTGSAGSFSPLTFLLCALGAVSAPFAHVVPREELQPLTPRRWGKGSPAKGWSSRRDPVLQGPCPWSGGDNLLEQPAVSPGFGGGGLPFFYLSIPGGQSQTEGQHIAGVPPGQVRGKGWPLNRGQNR